MISVYRGGVAETMQNNPPVAARKFPCSRGWLISGISAHQILQSGLDKLGAQNRFE
jgi:hypothetical protein